MDYYPQVGQIAAFPQTFLPQGWTVCDGRLLMIDNTYEGLFQMIGNQYGGDPQLGTFALPNLSDPIPGMRYLIAFYGLFPRDGGPPATPPDLMGFAAEWTGGPPSQHFVVPTGQIMMIRDNKILFTVLGTIFGGDIRAGTFALPNLGGDWVFNTTGPFPPKS